VVEYDLYYIVISIFEIWNGVFPCGVLGILGVNPFN